ncbi:MAG: FkbM family methyltransferase [Actinomycetota bacterium]
MKHVAWIPTGRDGAQLRRIDLADGRASTNQRQLRRHGLAGWQPETTAALLAAWELSPRPGVFFDIGANAGVYALLCRLLQPSFEVVAFEPAPDTIEAGRRWAAANGVDVRFEQLAISDARGRATLYLSSRSDASNSLVAGFRTAKGTLEVDRLDLDTYVEREGLVPTVVKIDVEQHEAEVIAGARRTLAEHRPVVVVELLGARRTRVVDRRLRELGYQPQPLGGRDHLYWPDVPPPDWHTRLASWRTAVERCTARRSLPRAIDALLSRGRRGRQHWGRRR